MKTIVLDWRNFAKNVSYSIMSGSIACAFPTEVEEIAHRIIKRLLCIRLENPDARIIIANDVGPYWRKDWLLKWYSDRGLEPVLYKGNRVKQTWPFATSKENIESLYKQLLVDGAKIIDAVVIEDKGLEADDIWGVLSEVLTDIEGWSADSDWRQKIKDGVTVYDFTQELLHSSPIDIRVKWLAGDGGDNIKGCTKFKKNGQPMEKGWGKDGAEKHITENPEDWHKVANKDELDRNWMVTTLPCPTWDVEQVAEILRDLSVQHSTVCEEFERLCDFYGVTASVRALLTKKAERDAFIAKLRLHFLRKSEDNA